MNEREKMIYKFWIQNLSNEKFDNIINGLFFFNYYKFINIHKIIKSIIKLFHYLSLYMMFQNQNHWKKSKKSQKI